MEQLEYDLLSAALKEIVKRERMDFVVIASYIYSAHLQLHLSDDMVNHILNSMKNPDPQSIHDHVRKNSTDMTLQNNFSIDVPYGFMTLDVFKEMCDSFSFAALRQAFPKCDSYFNVSRVGFDQNKRRAFLYIGHHEAWEAAYGWFEVWCLNERTLNWQHEQTLHAWNT